MANCELLEKCIFFNDQMEDMPAVASLMKSRYCNDNYEDCARMMVVKAIGRENVPNDMFPNQVDYAQRIIGRG